MADLRQLTDACVHCGFCLPACPTYQLWGEEMDSPRGRIHLVRQVVDGAPMSPTIAGHLDACLGCLACVPACPSGVRYDKIIEDARVLVEAGPARGFGDRVRRAAVFALFPYPRRLRLMRGPLRLAQALRLTGPRLTRLLPATPRALARLAPPVLPRAALPEIVPARPGGRPGPARARVGLLTGCVQSAFFGHVSAATVNVLSMEGCEVVVPRGQGCCGALARHTGRARQGARQARRTVATFAQAGVDAIVTDVAGCGSVMKEYADVLGGDPKWSVRAAEMAAKVRDVTELLASLGGPVAPRHPLDLTVAYHDACHLSHGQGVRAQPRGLLRSVPGLRVVSPVDADVCCGSAGVYNLLAPEPAAQLGARKAAALRATGADVVVAGNPGCLLQIAAAMRADGGRAIPTRHTIEILDASLRGVSPLSPDARRGTLLGKIAE